MFFLRDIRSRAYNGTCIWRLLHTFPQLDDFDTYKEFKYAMAHTITFAEALAGLITEGITDSTYLGIDPHAKFSAGFTSPSTTPSKAVPSKKKEDQFFHLHHLPSPVQEYNNLEAGKPL